MSRERATRKSLPTFPDPLPLPKTREKLPYQRRFSQEEYDLISFGLIPHSMDHKWFIFLENNILYLHRSWTMRCIYQLDLVPDGDDYIVSEAFVNRDRSQYRGQKKQYELALLDFLIDNFLLGKREPFPIPRNRFGQGAKGAFQHNATGTGYPEKVLNEDEQRPWWKFWK